jgi:hypothetical protein
MRVYGVFRTYQAHGQTIPYPGSNALMRCFRRVEAVDRTQRFDGPMLEINRYAGLPGACQRAAQTAHTITQAERGDTALAQRRVRSSVEDGIP